MELVEQLRKDGIAKGLCQPWQMKLRDGSSMQRLIRLYIRGIDFCIKNDYPTLEFIRQNFKGKCEPYGVYVDDDVHLVNNERLVVQGDCKGELSYTDFSASSLYIRHNSDITVNVSGHAVLAIDMFDNSHINLVVAGTRAKVFVSIYGDARIDAKGKVKIFYKHKKNY